MDDLFRNVRSIIENEIRRGTETFVIYPFSDVGHLVREILEWDYGRKPIVVDGYLSSYNEEILSPQELKKFDWQSNVLLLSAGNSVGTPYFKGILRDMGARYLDVREPIYTYYLPEKEDFFKAIRKSLGVMSVRGGQKFTRVGRKHDGGYIMLDDFHEISKAYCFGISNDVSWEMGMAERGISCQMYDHTIDCLPEENALFSWEKKGVGSIDLPKKNLYSLETLMRENGDLNNKKLILKMDTEGAEWGCIENTSSDLLDNFVQMVFEFHDVTRPTNEYVLPIFEKLSKTHAPVWLHGNNNQPAEEAGGITFTPAIEVLYVNRRHYDLFKGEAIFPMKLDMPNNPMYPEVILGDFAQV